MALGCVAEQFLERHIPPKEPLVKGLLHKRDLVTFAGRRRHGKTTFLTNLAAALALNSDPFLGYEIPEARRSLMLLLEDDPAELQEKLARILGQSGTDGRLRVVTRDDCHENHVPIDISRPEFRQAVEEVAAEHEPDVIVIDNLAHVVNARYNDAELIHQLVFQLYEWARAYDAAVILAAHPRKEDVSHPVRLETDPEMFFETVMGSSHLVNSTGNLWGLQRHYDEDYAVFLGGRQRGEGQQAYTVIEKREDDWFKVLPRTVVTMDLLVNTQKRKEAWNLLPAHPQTFRYRQGQELVSSVMSSSASYANWMRDLRRHSLILDSGNELQKNPEAPTRVGV